MCGIFGYVNSDCPKTKEEICNVLIKGLERQEYRGYDSAGIAVQDDTGKEFLACKSTGRVELLRKKVDEAPLDGKSVFNCHVGIAHTRWATHGVPSERNSHPVSSDKDNKFLVVHNGIITNYREIKELLEKNGYAFYSDTDTECTAKLALYEYDKLSKENKRLSFPEIVSCVIDQLEGAFALLFISSYYPNELVAARRGSPLLIGIKSAEECKPIAVESIERMKSEEETKKSKKRAEYIIASDASAIVEHTQNVCYLEDEDIAYLNDDGFKIYHSGSAQETEYRQISVLNLQINEIMKGKYAHFMQKEIFEQTESLVNTMRGRIDFANYTVLLRGITPYIDTIRKSQRLLFISCGTSFHSCLSTQNLFEELCGFSVTVELASDFLDRKPPIMRSDVCIFVSQSGETADSLIALRYCLGHGAICIGVTNTVGSTISRETHCGIHVNAGPEIGVASTKAYTSQYTSLVMIALYVSQNDSTHNERRKEIIDGLKELPNQLAKVLDGEEKIKKIAKDLKEAKSVLILGRGYQRATCLEAALKIKEVSYIHCEGIASGELKHGPLALVDETIPVILIITKDQYYEKSQNALSQVSARKGKILVICEEDDTLMETYETIKIPHTVDCLQGIITIVPFQLLSYHLALEKCVDVDCPRNLAKSVTVE